MVVKSISIAPLREELAAALTWVTLNISSIFIVFESNADREINDQRMNPSKHANCIYIYSIFKNIFIIFAELVIS